MRYPYKGHGKVTHPSGQKPDSWFSYCCSYCNHDVSGAVVSHAESGHVKWLWCTNCGCASVYHRDDKLVRPGVPYGHIVEGLPSLVDKAYEESRQCMAVGSYTACELICRNILMYVASDKGCKKIPNFAAAINYLASEGYVTKPMLPWVDKIREHGNKAAHELEEPNKDRSESTIRFTSELLVQIYEMEHLTKRYAPDPDSDDDKNADNGEITAPSNDT